MSTVPRTVGVVLGADTVPRWQQLAIDEVASTGVEASVFRAAARPGGGRLLGLVERWDRRRFGTPGDLLDTTIASPVPTALAHEPAVDLLLWLSDAPLPTQLAARLPLGLWYLRQGRARTMAEGPLMREVRSGRGLVHTDLWSFDGARHALLLRSVGTADTLSLHRARLRAYAKAARLPTRMLRAVARGGAGARRSAGAPPPPARAGARLGLTMAARVLARLAVRRLRGAFFEERWVIGWRAREPGAALDGVKRYTVLEPPAGHYYADPFPLERDGVAALLFEDYPSATEKGVIAAAGLGAGAPAPRTVVELEGHTSYPFLLEEGDELFMVPESRQAGRIELWRAESFPERWAPVRPLIDDLPAADATLLRHDGRLWLFAAVAADDGAPIDELHLFHAGGLDQPWEAHPLNPVVSDVRRARPAGPVFRHEGALVRPAQDCSRAYGWRTVLNRIDVLSTGDYRETPLATVRPAGPLVTRTHTFSVQGGLEAVDALRLLPRLGPLRRRPPATVALRVAMARGEAPAPPA